MSALIFETPREIILAMTHRCHKRRLDLNLTQKTLSARSGVSLAVVKQFEKTGKIALLSLVKIASVLGALSDFQALFKKDPLAEFLTLDDVLKAPRERRRGRQ